MERQLIFVYNANTDPLSAMVGYAHKLFKPSTYKCELCALTHHNLGERKAWKKFKERSKVGMEFRYIRGFENEFNLRYEYPVIIERRGNDFDVLFKKQALQKVKSVEELIEQLEKELERV